MVQALAEAVNATAIGDADGPVVQAFRDRMQAWITDHATLINRLLFFFFFLKSHFFINTINK